MTHSQVRLSVIVPFCNERRYLRMCAESLLAQTLDPGSFEIIFVDNNSTDDGASVVKGNPRIQVLSEKKPGSYAARNAAILRAKGEILAFTDADCVASPDWLEKILNAFLSTGVGIVVGHRSAPPGGRALQYAMDYEKEKARYIATSGVAEIMFGHTNNMAVRRELFDRVGLFPERIRGGDTVFVRRACNLLGTGILHFEEEVLVCHQEIRSLGTYFQKCRIYGESNRLLASEVEFRPLSLRQRLEVLYRVIAKSDEAGLCALVLTGVLFAGLIAYEDGRRRAGQAS